MAVAKGSRAAAADATRAAIVAAARQLFFDRGYHGAGIDDIAREAGVAVQTIYNSIGGKRAVLARVLDYAVTGDEATPLDDIGKQLHTGIGDPRRLIRSLVSFWLESFERTLPVLRVIRDAAAVDPEIAALERQRELERFGRYRNTAARLRELGGLREGISIDDAAGVLFTLGHPSQYRFFVEDLRWSRRRWADWVTAALTSSLLDPATAA